VRLNSSKRVLALQLRIWCKGGGAHWSNELYRCGVVFRCKPQSPDPRTLSEPWLKPHKWRRSKNSITTVCVRSDESNVSCDLSLSFTECQAGGGGCKQGLHPLLHRACQAWRSSLETRCFASDLRHARLPSSDKRHMVVPLRYIQPGCCYFSNRKRLFLKMPRQNWLLTIKAIHRVA